MYAMSLAFDMMMLKFSAWLEKNNISDYDLIVMTDGNVCPKINFDKIFCEPKADAKYHSVMAASILAKVCRDKIMLEMDKKYPEYGYAKHKGYPTVAHREICKNSFKGWKNLYHLWIKTEKLELKQKQKRKLKKQKKSIARRMQLQQNKMME